MTDVMPQSSLALNAPSSRQDIVSALLSDYGNSFGHGEISPSTYSPVSVHKDLPPPPPAKEDSIYNKPLPAVQRMSMKFQLRVDEEELPSSPEGSPKGSPGRRRIVSRSLSRGAKPPSLTLTTSNGSTAAIPFSPPPAIPSSTYPASLLEAESKELPPPPPEKSIRRKSVKQPSATQTPAAPVTAKELSRSDSLLSQEEAIPMGQPNSKSAPGTEGGVVSPIKRKAVPVLKKFKSLAELSNGPRGGKTGPQPALPPTSAPRKDSVDSQVSEKSLGKSSIETVRRVASAQEIPKQPTVQPQSRPATQTQTRNEQPMRNNLPPTPDEDKPLPVPEPTVSVPRKPVFAGLPSNPRAKGPASPLHARGKSSTGYNLMKGSKAAPQAPTVPVKDVTPMTPDMTPSPKLRPELGNKEQVISPLSPLPPPQEQRRPFSFEGQSAPKPVEKDQAKQPLTAGLPSRPGQGMSSAQPQTQAPPHQATLREPEMPAPQQQQQFQARRPAPPAPNAASQAGVRSLEFTSLAPQVQNQYQNRPAQPVGPAKSPMGPSVTNMMSSLRSPAGTPSNPFADPNAPSTPFADERTLAASPPPTSPTSSNYDSQPSTSPTEVNTVIQSSDNVAFCAPFSPLTNVPVPHTTSEIPPITSAHVDCYTSHATAVWSTNRFRPLGCMLCLRTSREQHWRCNWCLLRICGGCQQELRMVPGRDLGVLLKWREGEMQEDGMRGRAGSPEIVVQSEEEKVQLQSVREFRREDAGIMGRGRP